MVLRSKPYYSLTSSHKRLDSMRSGVNITIILMEVILLTQNQIAYWNLQETKRANSETNRHNVATENETARHNLAGEQFNISNLNESIRHNKVTETETNRHNVVTENETNRHNVAGEQFNIAQLQEQQRHNIAGEQFNISQLAETTRHNKWNESIDYFNSRENQRAHLENERQTAIRNNETERHNKSTESIQKSAQDLQSYQIAEQKRHNKATEEIDTARQVSESAYKKVMRQVELIKLGNNSDLTYDQRAKIQREIDKMDQDYSLAKKKQTLDTWHQVNESANSIANIIKAILGGRR